MVPDQNKDVTDGSKLPKESNETVAVPVQIEIKFESTDQNMDLIEKTCTTVILTNMSQEGSEGQDVFRLREQRIF